MVFDLFIIAAAVFQAGGQTPKAKPKLHEDGDQRDTMMSMISMASSESTVAGLMSLSVPSSASLLSDKEQGAPGSAQTWTGKGVPEQTNSEVHTPAKVSLSEYRAKNADVLAAQKRKLENMEASVKRDYANAAQALIGQQLRKEKQQHHQQPASTYSDLSSPSPIILKIPLEKEKHERSALKMRFPVAGGGGSSGHSARGQDPDIKVRIRMPEKQRGGSGEDSKSRDKHRERSNHHHHYYHHSSSGSSLSSSHKHSSSSGAATGSSKKVSSDFSRTSSSSSSTSRKRMHSQHPSAPISHPASKLSKSSRNLYQLTSLSSSSGQALGHTSDLLPQQGVPHHQGGYSHGKGSDKLDTNGHGGGGSSQSNEYQDTFEMLNSLLSAQGVQPAQPSVFDYRTQYGDYRYSGGARAGNPRPPPLPSEPPPPLPPLPK